MKTLEDHNKEAVAHMTPPATEARNGIACPKCGDELFDDRTCVLASNPPQTRVFCKKCWFIGSRY